MRIDEILALLRHEMSAEGINAIIFPTDDPHGSEYVAAHWQARRYVSGFTGSAGTAVVTQHEAALWTDSRYFLQAEEELRGTEYQLMREGLADTPTITDWLLRKMSLHEGTCVAVDGMVATYADVEQMAARLRKIGVSLRTNYDAMRMVWTDRPAVPRGEIYAVESQWIGESTVDKLQRIRTQLRKSGAEACVVTDLMEVAWTLNLRGSDIPMTPVFIAFMHITLDEATLFADGSMTAEALAAVREAGVDVRPYADFLPFIRQRDERTLCDGSHTRYNIYKVLTHIVDAPSPITLLKAVKNSKEVEGFRQAMLLDGVAMVRWLRWLKPAVAAGGQTEISVSRKLEQLRREHSDFLDLSFSTICGYGAHGAIVHYTATPDTDAPLRPEGLLLTDSGAHYRSGTTDITRTVALGPVSDEMRRAYTLVLKAHIALATTPFPEGTNGTQLDSVARSVLWRGGLHYMHGTGHGVGWRLCVHEGPHAIRQDWRPEPLLPDMVVTNEPGVYLAGRFGIRTENVMLVEPREMEGAMCRMLALTPLTLCPIDTTPIDASLLTLEERQWLNDYHSAVREALLPLLTDEEDREWLKRATIAL